MGRCDGRKSEDKGAEQAREMLHGRGADVVNPQDPDSGRGGGGGG